jgi:Ca2+-binding RTX toxin-like protein
MTADLNGGSGSDLLEGAAEDDTLFSGGDGRDVMRAGDGTDALISSGSGGDVLDGGTGNDQLTTDDVCQGHDYSGGPGFDVAGFARYLNVSNGVRAQLGGTASDPKRSGCRATQVGKDLEILEGSRGPDELFGTNGKDPLIIGGQGDDVIHGLGSADNISGDGGNDSLFGDGGYDTLEAQDGQRDRTLHCGGGGGQVLRDKGDPAAAGCHKQKKGRNKRRK